ncbi:hypothetical protein ACVIHI_007715 [Bradyrhizobium sp. USDA 4524]|nr:hypothetical protein [Bradyrhizobium sp. USDA 4538]MCP1899935.1 hypothetical protein [Bradyrhizobium sp. USDA 4537]MCP1985956.1 hypothetical protein [Bradyrhizobium sp. USDA 4539]
MDCFASLAMTWRAWLSFRDGPRDQTAGAQLRTGNLEIPGSVLRIAPE